MEDAEGHTRLTCPVVNKAHTVEVLPGAVCPGTPHGIPEPPGAISELRSTASRKREASAVRPGCQEGFLATRRCLGAPATRTVCPGAPKGRTLGHSVRRLKSSLATGTRPADGRAYQRKLSAWGSAPARAGAEDPGNMRARAGLYCAGAGAPPRAGMFARRGTPNGAPGHPAPAWSQDMAPLLARDLRFPQKIHPQPLKCGFRSKLSQKDKPAAIGMRVSLEAFAKR